MALINLEALGLGGYSCAMDSLDFLSADVDGDPLVLVNNSDALPNGCIAFFRAGWYTFIIASTRYTSGKGWRA